MILFGNHVQDLSRDDLIKAIEILVRENEKLKADRFSPVGRNQ